MHGSQGYINQLRFCQLQFWIRLIFALKVQFIRLYSFVLPITMSSGKQDQGQGGQRGQGGQGGQSGQGGKGGQGGQESQGGLQSHGNKGKYAQYEDSTKAGDVPQGEDVQRYQEAKEKLSDAAREVAKLKPRSETGQFLSDEEAGIGKGA